MQQFEKDYAKIIEEIMLYGEVRSTRNATTISMFSKTLTVDCSTDKFPLVQGRKMYPQGVFGEFAAMVRKLKHVDDFTKWGCNYWHQWSDADGNLVVDYGNAWHADGQIDHLKYCLRSNQTDRRMIINGWRPERLQELSLPCCHMMYQFYVRNGKYLDMVWYQRFVDMMVGVPSDIVLGATWLITLANEFGFIPGKLHMHFGDCHVYEQHWVAASKYLKAVDSARYTPVTYILNSHKGKDFLDFKPKDIILSIHQSGPKLNLEVIS